MTVHCFIYTFKVWAAIILISPFLVVLTGCVIDGPGNLAGLSNFISWYIVQGFLTTFGSFLAALFFWISISICIIHVSGGKARIIITLIIGLLLTGATALFMNYGLDDNATVDDTIKWLIPYCLCASWAMLFFRKHLLVENYT